jgi:hypothetical protein
VSPKERVGIDVFGGVFFVTHQQVLRPATLGTV